MHVFPRSFPRTLQVFPALCTSCMRLHSNAYDFLPYDLPVCCYNCPLSYFHPCYFSTFKKTLPNLSGIRDINKPLPVFLLKSLLYGRKIWCVISKTTIGLDDSKRYLHPLDKHNFTTFLFYNFTWKKNDKFRTHPRDLMYISQWISQLAE